MSDTTTPTPAPELLALPEPVAWQNKEFQADIIGASNRGLITDIGKYGKLYTADQMRAYALANRAPSPLLAELEALQMSLCRNAYAESARSEDKSLLAWQRQAAAGAQDALSAAAKMVAEFITKHTTKG